MPEVVEDVFSFGAWVRRRRKALDLTQAALAHRVGCAEVTIRKLEADAFRPSREIADLLARCLDIPPDSRDVFVQVARAERSVDRLASVPPSGSMSRDGALADKGLAIFAEREHVNVLAGPQTLSPKVPLLHNFPAETTPLIGREREIAEVSHHLLHADVRLLTMTGPGGIGKTRLALRVAVDVVPHFSDGVFFVPLATIVDPRLVPATIAQVLGIHETAETSLVEGLKNYLCDRHILLILDNFEQLLPAALLIAELLRAAPGLKVLLTSRSVVHVYGERHFSVPSLAYPDPTASLPAQVLLQSEAIQLFIDRARAVTPNYPFTDTNISLVAQICQRLEGLPLAIELAAARIRLFSPAGMLSRLEHALRFLKGGSVDQDVRHQTLENTIAWSYELLLPSEQTLFRRLAVFVDGWTLEAATMICDVDDSYALDLYDGVQALLDKSLLREIITASGEPRFSMLGIIREFALGQLVSSGEGNLLGERHAAYYQTLATQAEAKFVGAESSVWLDQIEAEYGNLRAALEWLKARPSQAEAGLRLAGSLWHFWDIRGQFTEGRSWLATMLAHGEYLPAEIRATALDGAGVLARHQGDYAQAHVSHAESLQLWTALADTRGIASAHVNLGLVAYHRADFLTAKHHLNTVVTLLESEKAAPAAYDEVLTQALNALGKVFRGQGDFEQARTSFKVALGLSRRLGDQRLEGEIFTNLGGLEICLRRYEAAQEWLLPALDIKRTLKDRIGEALTLHNLAVAEQETYHYGDAKDHFLAALQVHESTGNRREQINVQLGLGVLYYQIANLAEAQKWLQEALVLSRVIGDDVGSAYVLANLGPVLRDLGDLPQAAQALQEGMKLAEIQMDLGTQSYCVSHLAMVHLEAEQAADAIRCALQALEIRGKIDMLAWTTPDLATLAAAYLATGQHEHARTYADQAIEMLRKVGASASELPQRDYFTCYQVYAMLGQIEQARESLQAAYTIVLSQAAKIPDPASQQLFTEQVATNRAIVQEVQRVTSTAEHA